MKLEAKDFLTLLAVVLGVAVTWGTTQARLDAHEEAIKPLPQMRTDIEVVKAAVLDMRDDLRALRRGRRSE